MAKRIYRVTGCPTCDKLPGVDRCLKCQKDELDAEMVAVMKRIEKLEKEIEKTQQEIKIAKENDAKLP